MLLLFFRPNPNLHLVVCCRHSFPKLAFFISRNMVLKNSLKFSWENLTIQKSYGMLKWGIRVRPPYVSKRFLTWIFRIFHAFLLSRVEAWTQVILYDVFKKVLQNDLMKMLGHVYKNILKASLFNRKLLSNFVGFI